MLDKPRTAAEMHFTAPENLDGSPANEKSDLYALGAAMYLMLTGAPPVASRDSMALSPGGVLTRFWAICRFAAASSRAPTTVGS